MYINVGDKVLIIESSQVGVVIEKDYYFKNVTRYIVELIDRTRVYANETANYYHPLQKINNSTIFIMED